MEAQTVNYWEDEFINILEVTELANKLRNSFYMGLMVLARKC